MIDSKHGTCFLCSKPIARGTRIVQVTDARDGGQRVFHLDCFTAFTTGAGPDRDVWTYRIVHYSADDDGSS